MKKILLLSDTHGHMDEKIISYINQADEVWHAGDIGKIDVLEKIEKLKPLRAVYGNIDGHRIRIDTEEVLIFSCEEVKVVMTHIGGYPGRYNARAKELIEKHQPQLFICGHSHILKVIQDKKRNHLHMNPGAVGISGFHKIRTMLRFKLHKGKISQLEAIELGIRGALSNTINRTD